MKIFDVRTQVDDSGEYILGVEDTGSHACYLIYGTMKPGEKGRLLKPGGGHEELILAARGNFLVSGHIQGELKEGQAIYLKGEETCWLENETVEEAFYVVSGGHSEGGHH
jgi:hypothetical protein